MSDSEATTTVASNKPRRGTMRTYSAPVSPRVTISVTQETIERAEKRDSENCMIAETIAATIPNAVSPVVDASTIRWTDADRGLRYTFQTPLAARHAIYRFDRGDHLEPFSFQLRNAWVHAAHRSRGGARMRLPVSAWRALQDQVKDLRKKRGLDLQTTADEIGIPKGSLSVYLSKARVFPGNGNADKVEAWVLKQTGGKPAKRVKSQAHKVAGPTQFRKLSPGNRAAPSLVGGNPPPINARYRQFGLRAFDWK